MGIKVTELRQEGCGVDSHLEKTKNYVNVKKQSFTQKMYDGFLYQFFGKYH